MSTGFAKDIIRFFLSRRTAVTLLLLTLLLLLLSTRLQDVNTVTSSPFFLVLPLLIFLSTIICTTERLIRRTARPPDVSAFRTPRRSPAPVEEISLYLVNRGWERISAGEGDGIFAKGGRGFWGSMVFHTGILFLIAAAFMTALTLFSAYLVLTEGQPTSLEREGFFKILREPVWPVSLPAGEVVLDQFNAVYKDERFPVDYAARLRIKDFNGERNVDVRVNEPLQIGDIQYTMYGYGFSPGFIIKGVDGKMLFDGYVMLSLLDGEEDYFNIPETGQILYVRFFPDFVATEEGVSTRSRVPRNPVFGLRLEGMNAAGRGKTVRMGSEVEMDGLVISPIDLKHWVKFDVVRDHGKTVLLPALFLMSGGLIIRYVYHEKWLRVTVIRKGNEDHAGEERGEDEIELSGYSRYFPALFEREVEQIVESLSSR